MTKKDYEILKKYESPLYSISHAGYARTHSEDWVELAQVYERLFKRTLTKNQLSCGECKKKALKLLAQEFYAYKNKKEPNLNLNLGNKNGSEGNNTE